MALGTKNAVGQITSFNRHILMFLKTFRLLPFLLAFASASYAEPSYQAHSSLYQVVSDFVQNNIDPTSNYELTIAPLDTRLRLAECSQPIEAFTSQPQGLGPDRNTVGVRCSGIQSWSVYTSVTVRIFDQVMVLSQPVQRGELLTPNHVRLEKKDISKVKQGYFISPEQVFNKQANRYLAAGTVLHNGLIMEPVLIKRGEKIVIRSGNPAFDIRMQGVAMMDGVKGQSISVKNASSGRIIAAEVEQTGFVSIHQR